MSGWVAAAAAAVVAASDVAVGRQMRRDPDLDLAGSPDRGTASQFLSSSTEKNKNFKFINCEFCFFVIKYRSEKKFKSDKFIIVNRNFETYQHLQNNN